MNNWDVSTEVGIVVGPNLPQEAVFGKGMELSKAAPIDGKVSVAYMPRGDREATSILNPHAYGQDTEALIETTLEALWDHVHHVAFKDMEREYVGDYTYEDYSIEHHKFEYGVGAINFTVHYLHV